jgi:hypothetical protein
MRLLALLALLSPAAATPPTWWTTGIPPIITGTAENNHGPANIGQAKWMLSEALRALDTAAPTIATQIRADLAGTAPSYADRILDLSVPEDPKPADWADKQKAPLLIGQLKAISAPFYSRLAAAQPTWLAAERATNGTNQPDSIFPWTATTDDDANKAIATIGQLKAVFSLRFETLTPPSLDTDGDGIPNSWEILYGLNPNNAADASGDLVGDGVTNLIKFKIGRNPLVVALPDTAGLLDFKVHTPLE